MSSLHFYDKTKGGTVPVSADSPLPISGTFSADPPVGGATEAKQDVGNTSLDSIDDKLPALEGTRVPTQILRRAGVARQLTAGVASANTALTASCTAISMRAVGAAVRYSVGTGAQTADAATSHFLADGERMDLAVEANSQIAVIRDDTTDAVVELTELI